MIEIVPPNIEKMPKLYEDLDDASAYEGDTPAYEDKKIPVKEPVYTEIFNTKCYHSYASMNSEHYWGGPKGIYKS